MRWEDRNDACPCGSGKKNKKCYSVEEFQNTCQLFLEENQAKYISEIQKYLDGITKEVSESLHLLISKWVLVRSRVILILSMVDTYTKIWWIYDDFKKPSDPSKFPTDSELWVEWFQKFIFVKENTEYIKWSLKFEWALLDLNWADFHKVRSSLSHWFWLWWSKLWFLHMWDHPKVKELAKTWLFVVNPEELFLIIWKGCTLMIDAINWAIKINPKVGLIKARRLSSEIIKNGVASINFQ
jgi:hypothetical protein